MKHIFQTVCVWICLVALLIPLTGCTGDKPQTPGPADGTQPESTPTDTGEQPELPDATSLSNYTIIRSDFKTSSSPETKLAIALRQIIQQATGLELEMNTDWVDRGSEVPTDTLEILVGETNRPESKQVMESLAENAYAVKRIGTRIVIAGKGEIAMGLAYDYFLTTYFGYDKKAGTTSVTKMDPTAVVAYEGLYVPPTPADILSGIFKTDVTVKEIAAEGGIGGGFGMHFPDFVRVGDEIYAYYICYQTKSGKPGTGLAISSDGVNFVDHGCVLEPGIDENGNETSYDSAMSAFAGVWYDETEKQFYLTYESNPESGGADIGLAVSTDGEHFVKKGIILHHDRDSKWQNYNIGTPDLYRADGVWYLTFHGFGSGKRDCQIGIATGSDIYHLTVQPDPIIPTSDNPADAYSGTCGRRDVIYLDGWYYMVFEVSTDSGVGGVPYWDFGSSNWTHLYARSKDLKTWEKITTPLGSVSKGDFGYDGPCFLTDGNDIYVYVRMPGGCSTTRYKLVISED